MKNSAVVQTIRDAYFKIPKSIRIFLVRAVIIFICWQTVYILLLQPKRVIDRPLTNFTASSTANVFSWISPFHARIVNYPGFSTLFVGDKEVIGIQDGCNGLELFILYLGFLICLPTDKKSFLLFSFFGIIGIYLLNIVRETTLVYLYMKDKTIGDFAHHYIFKVVVYGCIFYSWVLYSKKLSLK